MKAFLHIGVLGLSAAVARATCTQLRNLLANSLSGDITLTLEGDADCPILTNNDLEEFEVSGGELTLTGPSTTKFTNLLFTIMDGAKLIFDFDTTEFGPNLGFEFEDDYGGYMVQVMSGGSVEFLGKMKGTGLDNMRSVFYNEAGGSIEFASDATFEDNGSNIFRTNYGRLRFYGDATFTNNRYLAISNDGGSVRINGDALFIENGGSFDGHSGGAFDNDNGGTAIFRGAATFGLNECDEDGGGVFNGEDSKMTFYKKVTIYDNWCKNGNGGGLDNRGTLTFRGAVTCTGNRAANTGGGIATGYGGTTTFYGWATIQNNGATVNGGGMSLYVNGDSPGGNVVEFRQPSKVDVSLNEVTGPEAGCNQIFVESEDGSEIIGYEGDDPCDLS